jgi:hypothetical protein
VRISVCRVARQAYPPSRWLWQLGFAVTGTIRKRSVGPGALNGFSCHTRDLITVTASLARAKSLGAVPTLERYQEISLAVQPSDSAEEGRSLSARSLRSGGARRKPECIPGHSVCLQQSTRAAVLCERTTRDNRAGGSTELGEMSDVRSGSLCLMTTLHRGHALLHLTR